MMNSVIDPGVPRLAEAAHFRSQQIVDLARSRSTLRPEVEALKHQLEWFKRQVFGQNGERRRIDGASA